MILYCYTTHKMKSQRWYESWNEKSYKFAEKNHTNVCSFILYEKKIILMQFKLPYLLLSLIIPEFNLPDNLISIIPQRQLCPLSFYYISITHFWWEPTVIVKLCEKGQQFNKYRVYYNSNCILKFSIYLIRHFWIPVSSSKTWKHW